MSVASHSPQKQLFWQDFVSIDTASTEETETPLKIRNSLRQLLEQYEESEFIKYLVAPSAEALSGYFQCTTEEVEQGLQQLKQLGYDYESRGSHHPITLWDPLVREKTLRRESPSRFKLLYENFFMIPPAFSH
jgi:hypothetical protein